MKLTDGKKTVEIELIGKNDIDWSEEFFETGALEYDEAQDTYKVDDVQYCIEQATDYIHGYNEFGMMPQAGERLVIDGETIAYCGE
jgi:hypothetical protein